MTKHSKNRTAIVIAGMHRSGTSAVAGALVAMGCSPPRTLMPATEQHPNRTWESSRLVELNDRILESAGSIWCDWRPLNPDWFETPVADAFRVEAQSAIEDEFAGHALFIFKDPRICRFLPIWIDALNRAEIDTKIILPIRHPVEVVMSLAQRYGLSPYIGHLLWLRHVLDAEYFSRKLCRSIFLWDPFLENPTKTIKQLSEQLHIKWPRHHDFAVLDARTSVSADLKHHKRGLAQPASFLSEIGEEVFELFESLTHDGSGVQQKLDDIRVKVATASEILGPLLAPAERIKHAQLSSSPDTEILSRVEELGYEPAGDRLNFFIPQQRTASSGTKHLIAELEDSRQRLARSDAALEEAANRLLEAETKTIDTQRQLAQALYDQREALRVLEDTNSKLEAAQMHSSELQKTLEKALERAHHGTLQQAEIITALNQSLLEAQDKLRQETVKAALATAQSEKWSAECERLKLSSQEYKSSQEVANKYALLAAENKSKNDHHLRLSKIGQSFFDALSLASDLILQSTRKIEQTNALFKTHELHQAECSHRLFPEWIPLDERENHSSISHPTHSPKMFRILSKWRTFRQVARGDEANRDKNWPVAAAFYARALKRSPSLAPIWVQYGHALKELGERSLAEIAYRRALKLEPFNADTHLQLGHLMKIMGRTDSARNAFLRATELDPSQNHAHNELARLPSHHAPPSLDALDKVVQSALREAKLLASTSQDPNALNLTATPHLQTVTPNTKRGHAS
jgi:tetratricopeptide (TPR) repeat protein